MQSPQVQFLEVVQWPRAVPSCSGLLVLPPMLTIVPAMCHPIGFDQALRLPHDGDVHRCLREALPNWAFLPGRMTPKRAFEFLCFPRRASSCSSTPRILPVEFESAIEPSKLEHFLCCDPSHRPMPERCRGGSAKLPQEPFRRKSRPARSVPDLSAPREALARRISLSGPMPPTDRQLSNVPLPCCFSDRQWNAKLLVAQTRVGRRTRRSKPEGIE